MLLNKHRIDNFIFNKNVYNKEKLDAFRSFIEILDMDMDRVYHNKRIELETMNQ